jgi:plastocyanin
VRRRFGAALVLTVAVAAAPAAHAQVIEAVDGVEPGQYSWSPANVTVKPGATVTWNFTRSTGTHNVMSASPNWNPPFRSGPPAVAPPPASYTFSAPGHYKYFCEVHQGMAGEVVVTDTSGNPPPPPPPPPLSEQPFPNDAGAPSAFEVADRMRPRITRVRARGRRHGARVAFRLDEPAMVTLRVQRARLTIKSRRSLFLSGRRTVTVRGLERGAYRIVLRARDLAGNRSRLKRVRVTVR